MRQEAREGILRTIHEKIRAKRWNLYFGISDLEDMKKIISRGPEVTLRTNRNYIILPEVSNPYDTEDVMGATFISSVTEHFPTFPFKGEEITISRIHFDDNGMYATENPSLKFIDYWPLPRLLENLKESFKIGSQF